MNEELIEELLYRSEGVDLDFKRAQYPFTGLRDDDKRSELLKDILAMANSWRDRTAYILLGFQEDKPNLPQVVGITEHLDDASIQQFVCSKIHPPLEFRYEELSFKGKHIAVISIPKQTRPFYVRSSYGKVHSNVVYVRRGSSTAEAEPPEVSRMAATDAGALKSPSVELTFVDGKGASCSSEFKLERYDFGNIRSLPDYEFERTTGPYGLNLSPIHMVNFSYWRELASYVQDFAGSIRMRVRLINHSSFALSDCKLKVAAELNGRAVFLKTKAQMADRPSKQPSHFQGITTLSDVLEDRAIGAQFYIDDDISGKTCVVASPKILPGESFTSSQYLAAFPDESGELTLSAKLYATELAVPVAMQAVFVVEVSKRQGDFELLRNLK